MERLGHWILAPNVPVPRVKSTALSSSVQSTGLKSGTAAVRVKPNWPSPEANLHLHPELLYLANWVEAVAVPSSLAGVNLVRQAVIR